MRAVLTALLLAALCGCWTAGSIVDGRPIHRDKFAVGASFFVDKTEPRVKKTLEDALRARGFDVREKKDDCDWILKPEIVSWQYSAAGYLGIRRRDYIVIAMKIVERKTGFVESRTTVEVSSDFRILAKYVETL